MMVVFTQWIAQELINQGFECIGTSNYGAYYFEDSQELEMAITLLTDELFT